jgi:putative ABC transport system ATP-binding protein
MIELIGINRVFTVGTESIYALKNINLSVAQGEYLSIMGPSGSGKSTLLNILGLLDMATSGTYLMDSTPVSGLSEDALAKLRQEKIGFIFQFFHLLPRLTALQNVELPMMLSGIDATERTTRAAKVLQSVGLLERAGHKPDQLSGGQQQRVAIARAAVMQPRLLLADEPTGNLDRHAGSEVVGVLEQLNQQGISLVVVTHDINIGHRAKRWLRMEDGEIVEDKSTTVTHNENC